MQKRTQQTALRRTKDLRVHGTRGRCSMHPRLVAVGAVLLIGVWAVARNTAGPGPDETP